MLRNVQLLRALAAFSVVAAHLGAVGKAPETAFVAPYTGFYGAAGVDVFFVISGFIMMYITRDGLRPAVFLLARFARIYPLWWMVSVAAAPATLLVIVGHSNDSAGHLLRSLFLIPAGSAGGKLVFPVVGVGWTLTYELFFYLAFAGALASGQRLLWAKVSAILLVAYLLHFLLPEGTARAFLSDPIYLEFIFGMIVAEFYLAHRLRIAVVAALATVAAALLWASPSEPDAYVGTRVLWWGIPAAAVLAFALMLERNNVRAPHLAVFLGDASYATYLMQFFAVFLLPASLFQWLGPLTPWTWVAVILIAAQIAGCAVYILVDRPLHDAARSVVRASSKQPATAPASRMTS